MEESLPPPGAEGNIFDQFDVQVTGELLPGGASIIDGYICRLPPCHGQRNVFESRRALMMHRIRIHLLPHTGIDKIPEEDQILQWLRSGKLRTNEIPQRSPERTDSPDDPAGSSGPGLLSKLLHSKPDTESDLQPASLESNIYEQFTVRHEPGEADGLPYVGYVCLLSPCHEEKVCLNTHAKWLRHRRSVHKETEEVQIVTLPNGYEIREWVILNKPRPYKVKLKPWKKGKLCPVDPAVFAEFDVKGTVEDDELRFFCLLDPCKETAVSFQGRRCWRKHRVKYHMSPEYEDGEYTLPSKGIIRDWMNAGKPHHYKPHRRVRTFITIDPSSSTITELHNREVNPTPSNVGNEVNGQKSEDLCLLPGDKESRKCSSENQHSQGHHQELHKLLPLEGRPWLRSSKSLARLGKLRPPTPPVEISRESRRRRGRRPRNADAAGCSSDTEPAQKKKKRHSMHSADRSHSTDNIDSDSSDLVAIRVVARGEDPSGSFWKQFMAEAANPTRDETPPSDDFDDGTEDVDDLSVDQTEEDPNPDHYSADMEEFGEKTCEDSARPEDALPSLPSSQPELHDSEVADVAEVEEDAHEEFEAPDDVVPSQPKLQDVKVVGHSSVQPQDFQGVTDEHQQNSTAEMTKAGEEAPEEFEAPDNVLPTQPESQNIKVVGHSSVQYQDFQGVTDEDQQNSNMAEFGKAHEEFINPWYLNPSVPSDVSEQTALPPLWHLDGSTFQCLPQDLLGENWTNSSKEDNLKHSAEMAKAGEKAPEEIVAAGNLSLSVQYESSEQNAVSTLKHYFRDALQFPTEDSPGETDNHRPNSNAEMTEVGEEAPEGFVAPGNFVPWIPLMQSEGTKVPIASVKDPIEIQAASIQEFVPRVHMDQFLVIGSNAAAWMAEVGDEAPEVFTVAPNNLASWFPVMQSEGTKLPSLEGHIDNQAAPIQESVPRVHMYPVFIEAPSAAGMSEVGEEALEELAAPGNLVPLLPSNSLQETSEQLYVSSLNTNPSSPDPRNIQNEPIIHAYPWPLEFIHMDIASMIEPMVVLPFAPSMQPEGREIGSIFMEGSAENSTENQVHPIQELTVTLMDVERAFESEPDLPLIDDPEEFLRLEAVAFSLQPMQQLFSPGNSESSNNFPGVPVLQTDSLIDMAAGLDYELSTRLQTDETDTCVVVKRVNFNSLEDSLELTS